ncbi:hypothetical protein BD311DRAFT_745062 [Dichomitus squalens]|uniref:Uncharacterized protein n=1 Tax=Dichomitus squalens TaxID=114155 RepID=A0A4Q9N2W3_9APHY|nr:hypothetical protein BD311DRAFT_745062 [Dichomitus squalens]
MWLIMLVSSLPLLLHIAIYPLCVLSLPDASRDIPASSLTRSVICRATSIHVSLQQSH